MRILWILAVLGLLAGLLVPVKRVEAVESFNVGPSAITFSFSTGEARSGNQQFTVYNLSGDLATYNLSTESYRIFSEEELAQGLRYADPNWVITQPAEITVGPRGKASINVVVNVPDSSPDGFYITYVRIDKGVETQRVTVSIRLGSAVLTHKYGIEPGFYKLSATGPGERSSKELSITVSNTGTAAGRYVLTIRRPDSLDKGYEPGDVDWIVVSRDTLVLEPGKSDDLLLKVVLPNSVSDGKYALWAAVSDMEQSSGVNLDYATKILLDIKYSKGGVSWVPIAAGVGGLAVGVVFVLGVLVIKRRRNLRLEVQR